MVLQVVPRPLRHHRDPNDPVELDVYFKVRQNVLQQYPSLSATTEIHMIPSFWKYISISTKMWYYVPVLYPALSVTTEILPPDEASSLRCNARELLAAKTLPWGARELVDVVCVFVLLFLRPSIRRTTKNVGSCGQGKRRRRVQHPTRASSKEVKAGGQGGGGKGYDVVLSLIVYRYQTDRYRLKNAQRQQTSYLHAEKKEPPKNGASSVEGQDTWTTCHTESVQIAGIHG